MRTPSRWKTVSLGMLLPLFLLVWPPRVEAGEADERERTPAEPEITLFSPTASADTMRAYLERQVSTLRARMERLEQESARTGQYDPSHLAHFLNPARGELNALQAQLELIRKTDSF